MDKYVSMRFQGINCASIKYESVVKLEADYCFLVESQTEKGVSYLVDMNLGVCGCCDGLPCSHQAAVVKYFHIPSVNCIPTLSSETRQLYASLALGSTSIKDPKFYSSIHQRNVPMVDSFDVDSGPTNVQLEGVCDEDAGDFWMASMTQIILPLRTLKSMLMHC